MPVIDSGNSYGIPREALLHDDATEGFWSSVLSGLGAAIEAPQHIVLSALSGRIPFTEDAPDSIREFKDIWGIESGEPVSRWEKAAVWGTAGTAVGGPLAGGIFAALSQVGFEGEEEEDLFGTVADLATDPLMYLHFGKLLGGGRVPVPAFSDEALGQVFTKAGTKRFKDLRKAISPYYEGLEKADDLAGAAAARTLLTEAGGLKGAVKSGLVQSGGMRFQLPFSDVGFTIPGTPAAGKALGRGARKLAPEGLKKGLGIYGPEMRDVGTKFHLNKRATMNKMMVATQRLHDEISKQGLDPDLVRPIGEVISSEPFLGLDEAMAKFMPGAAADVRDKVKVVMKATAREFDEAHSMAVKAGIDIPKLNEEAFERMLIRQEAALAAAQQGDVDKVIEYAAKQKKYVKGKLKRRKKARKLMQEDVETAINRLTAGAMGDAQDLLRRGYSAEEVASRLAQDAKRLDVPGKIQQKSVKKAAIDAEIRALEAELEGVTKDTSRVIRGIRRGDDMISKTEARINALQTEKAASGGYFPLIWDDQGKAMLQKAATDEAYARQLLDVDIPNWFGDKTFDVVHPSAPDLPEKMSMAKMARKLVEAGIEAERKGGFSAGNLGSPTAVHQFQRRLRVTAKMKVVDPDTGEASLRSLAVQRSFRADEFSPVVRGLEHMMGAAQPKQKVKNWMLGIGNKEPKVKPLDLFVRDPVVGVGTYHRNLGQPIALKGALDDIVKRFGRRVPRDTFQNLADGTMPGYVRMSEDVRKAFPGMQNAILPIEVAWDFERWYRNAMNPMIIAQFFAPYVAVIDYWKQMALAVPAFHARNAQSGIWQGIASGVLRNPWSAVDMAKLMVRRGYFGKWGKQGHLAVHRGMLGGKGVNLPWHGPGARTSYDDLATWMMQDGVEGPGFYNYESLLSEADNLRGPRAVTRLDRWLFKKNAQMGASTEYWLRGTQYIDALKQGFTREEASKIVAKTHFLYESLAPFESQILRRYIFPFWSWSRFNIPFTLEHMGKNPGLYRLAHKLTQDLWHDDAPKEPSLMPDWIRRQMGIPVAHDPATNEDTYFLLGNFWPASDIHDIVNDPIRKLVGDMTPAIRVPYEQATGKVAGSDWRIERFEGERAEFLGVNMEKRDIQLLRSFRWLNEIDRLVGSVPGYIAEGDVRGVSRYLAHALLGHKTYKYNRSTIARGVIYRNKMEIQRMRGHYIRSFLSGDMANAEAAMNWLAERGVAPPSYEDITGYEDRRESAVDRLMRQTQRVLAGSD